MWYKSEAEQEDGIIGLIYNSGVLYVDDRVIRRTLKVKGDFILDMEGRGLLKMGPSSNGVVTFGLTQRGRKRAGLMRKSRFGGPRKERLLYLTRVLEEIMRNGGSFTLADLGDVVSPDEVATLWRKGWIVERESGGAYDVSRYGRDWLFWPPLISVLLSCERGECEPLREGDMPVLIERELLAVSDDGRLVLGIRGRERLAWRRGLGMTSETS